MPRRNANFAQVNIDAAARPIIIPTPTDSTSTALIANTNVQPATISATIDVAASTLIAENFPQFPAENATAVSMPLLASTSTSLTHMAPQEVIASTAQHLTPNAIPTSSTAHLKGVVYASGSSWKWIRPVDAPPPAPLERFRVGYRAGCLLRLPREVATRLISDYIVRPWYLAPCKAVVLHGDENLSCFALAKDLLQRDTFTIKSLMRTSRAVSEWTMASLLEDVMLTGTRGRDLLVSTPHGNGKFGHIK